MVLCYMYRRTVLLLGVTLYLCIISTITNNYMKMIYSRLVTQEPLGATLRPPSPVLMMGRWRERWEGGGGRLDGMRGGGGEFQALRPGGRLLVKLSVYWGRLSGVGPSSGGRADVQRILHSNVDYIIL